MLIQQKNRQKNVKTIRISACNVEAMWRQIRLGRLDRHNATRLDRHNATRLDRLYSTDPTDPTDPTKTHYCTNDLELMQDGCRNLANP